MKIRYYLIIILLLLLAIVLIKVSNLPVLLNANAEEENPFKYSNRSLNIDIPKIEKEHYKKLVAFEKKLGIRSLLQTKDSIAIRFWLYSKSGSLKYLITMTSNQNQWSGKTYIIKYNSNDKNIAEITETKKTPLSGWSKAIEKINHYGIFALPGGKRSGNKIDEDSLNGFWGGEITYWVEVINDKYYRFYSYENPEEYCEESYDYYYFQQIAELLEVEFGIIELSYL